MGTRNLNSNGYPRSSWADTLDTQRSALRWDIKRSMRNLCKKLEEIGEECFVVTANINSGWVGHLGSVRGDEYIDSKPHILYDFLNYCAESLEISGNEEEDTEKEEEDAPLFPNLDNNSEDSDDRLVSLSRPEPEDCSDDLSQTLDTNTKKTRAIKVIFVPVYPASRAPAVPVVPEYTKSDSIISQSETITPDLDTQLLDNSIKTSEVPITEKGSKRKRKQTFKKKKDEDDDENDSDYVVDERIMAQDDTFTTVANTRRLRSSSFGRKSVLRQGKGADERDDTEETTDDSELEAADNCEADDDDDWVEENPKKQLKVQMNNPLKKGKERMPKRASRTATGKHQADIAADKTDDAGDAIDNASGDSHLESVSEMKFVISKGFSIGTNKLAHWELHPQSVGAHNQKVSDTGESSHYDVEGEIGTEGELGAECKDEGTKSKNVAQTSTAVVEAGQGNKSSSKKGKRKKLS